MNSMPDCSRIEPPEEPNTDIDGSQTKAAKQGWELFPEPPPPPPPVDNMALRGRRNAGSGGGGRDRMVSGGGPSSKQSPTQAAILNFIAPSLHGRILRTVYLFSGLSLGFTQGLITLEHRHSGCPSRGWRAVLYLEQSRFGDTIVVGECKNGSEVLTLLNWE